MPKRVLIIGGYGNFGSYIARALAKHPDIQLIIAGRSKDKATAFVTTLEAVHTPEVATFDVHTEIEASLKHIKPYLTIHTSGPYQAQDHFVAKACISQACHYIDLADARAFVESIYSLDSEAKDQNVSVISGASSVPGLSSCILDVYQSYFKELQSVDYGITTAQHINRGLATTEAILSYAGKPFTTLQEGKMQKVYGWQSLNSRKFWKVGRRLLANCDVPDLALFPERYPTLKTHRFYAGIELSFLHLGFWGLTWFVRAGLFKNLARWSASLLKVYKLFDWFGSDVSAFYMCMRGTDRDGK
ncbi:MAG: saccharopine dehydrogenase NADP-binding domain-containing protein, partial [Kordiimonas sp.]